MSMSPQILRIVGDASCMQPETSSVWASDRNPGEAIAETWPMGVILSPTCIDGLKISDEEEEEGDGTGSGISDPVKSVGVVNSMQAETSSVSASNTRLRYLAEAISRKGFKVKTEWWESNFSRIDAVSISDTHALLMTLERLLYSDINLYGGGVLPHNDFSYMTLDVLVGPCVLQVDAMVEIGLPSRRCLQLLMTDGVHHFTGLECKPIENLQVLDPAGLKIFVFNVPIRDRLLMLAPESAVVLGGGLVKLEQEAQAQKLVVEKVNKPPRGERATQAAWSLNDNAGSTTSNASHAQATGQGRTHISPLMTNDHYASIEATFARIESMQIDTVSLQRDRESSFVEVDESEVSNMVEFESESAWETLPFTDFAELTEKFSLTKDTIHSVHGVIMGSVAGIKVFGVSPSKYNIVFYVRDGCLKHEILLHNAFVEEFVGQSATEVFCAPSSSLAEDLKRLMLFLNFFQGMMVVEMNRSSQYPVALKMVEGCSLTDAKLLFEGITSSTTSSCN